MATDPLSSLLKQRQKEIDALAIQTREKFAAMQQSLEEEAVASTQKRVKNELSAFEKQVDRLLNQTRRRLQQELAKQLTQNLFGNGGGGGSGGQSQGQAISQLSNLLSQAYRNL